MPRRSSGDARSEILHVRLTPEERERLRVASDAEYLDSSAFARRAILQAVDRALDGPAAVMSPPGVNNPPAPTADKESRRGRGRS